MKTITFKRIYPTMIWKEPVDLENLNRIGHGNLVHWLGIEFTEVGDNYLIARMPVDVRTIQPLGMLHGGASATLAETVATYASMLCIDNFLTHQSLCMENNVHHLRTATEGHVLARAEPVRLGRKIHVWSVEIKDDRQRLIGLSLLTVAIKRRWEPRSIESIPGKRQFQGEAFSLS
jgi:1,4-dihydroxy-2-naphthoyl-CoA hydrolase